MRSFLICALLICSTPAWATEKQSDPAIVSTTNTEMTAIYDADQAVRKAPKSDIPAMIESDRNRRMQTQVLLDAGKLNSADDYYHAAFVFQHGDLPEDCLKAHALAVLAVARGKPEATWIAAATLDRYLQRIGQPQIYGTQYLHHGHQAWTQEPYRRDLLPDAIREASGVPPTVKQGEKLEYLAHKFP